MVLRTAEKKGRRRIGNRRRLPFELEVAREDFLEKMAFKTKTGKKWEGNLCTFWEKSVQAEGNALAEAWRRECVNMFEESKKAGLAVVEWAK